MFENFNENCETCWYNRLIEILLQNVQSSPDSIQIKLERARVSGLAACCSVFLVTFGRDHSQEAQAKGSRSLTLFLSVTLVRASSSFVNTRVLR